MLDFVFTNKNDCSAIAFFRFGLHSNVGRMGVQLAISLHSVDTSLRDELVPLNKTFPLQDIVDECRRLYVDSTLAHPITFEYVMLEGVNDSIVDAKQLSRLLQGFPLTLALGK